MKREESGKENKDIQRKMRTRKTKQKGKEM